MSREIDLWKFVADSLRHSEQVMLLVVARSSGSSPGRTGYKMAVNAGGGLFGSIGGGVMEVSLVEKARAILSMTDAVSTSDTRAKIIEQVHQKNVSNSSGMICSGRQTVIVKPLFKSDLETVDTVIRSLKTYARAVLLVGHDQFSVDSPEKADHSVGVGLIKRTDTDFEYREMAGYKDHLHIVGGGHCALALSELMSKLGFFISIYDDRPELNTIVKNWFADEISIVESYEAIGDLIPRDENSFVVVMTLGYHSDMVVIRSILNTPYKYLGVLGSKAKMKTLLNELRKQGFPADRLNRIHTPIGLPINSRTPEEIAVSIAAEIILIKNT